jgi:hypothetical protein
MAAVTIGTGDRYAMFGQLNHLAAICGSSKGNFHQRHDHPQQAENACFAVESTLRPVVKFGAQGPPRSIRGSHSAISGKMITRSRPVSCMSMNGHSERKMSCNEISGGATLFR